MAAQTCRPTELHWRFIDATNARIHWFDGEVVIFNPISWETHLLNLAAAVIVEQLLAGMRRVDEIARSLVEEGIALDPHAGSMEQQIASLLGQLERLGLVVAEAAEHETADEAP